MIAEEVSVAMNISVEHEERIQALPSQTRSCADLPDGTGRLECSVSGDLISVDRDAARWLRLCGYASQDDQGNSRVRQRLPGALVDLFDDLVRIILARTDAEDWRGIQIISLVSWSSRRLLLQGFGIPSKQGVSAAQIMMTLEEARFVREPLTAAV